MIFLYDDFELMYVMHKEMNKEQFLSASGAAKGYANDMFSRMYDALTTESVDLADEYETYYQLEYENFFSFLYRKYNLTGKQVESTQEILSGDPDLRLYKKLEYCYDGSELRRFMSEEPMEDRITKILIKK